MGLFKQMKDMKATVAAAPGMIEQAQAMGAQAQQMQAAQMQQMQAAQAAQAPAGPAVGPDFEPIAGVSLALFAEISLGVAAANYDQAAAPGIAASKGVGAADWQTAVDGWGARMQANHAVGAEFNRLYTGR